MAKSKFNDSSKRKFAIAPYRKMTLVVAVSVLIMGLLISGKMSNTRANTAMFKNLPAIQALDPINVDANANQVTIIRDGCKVVFAVDDKGNLVGAGTVQVKVKLTTEGTLSCTKHELDAPQVPE